MYPSTHYMAHISCQEAKRDDPDGTKAKARALKKAESYLAEERKLHEAYQILRTEADNKREQRKKAKQQMGTWVEPKEEEIKIIDEIETDDAKRNDMGIIESTSIPMDW